MHLALFLAQTRVDLTWVPYLVGLIGICGGFFAACAFIVRQKDLALLKPQIERMPLIEASINDVKQDVSEMKGVMSVIPALSVRVDHDQEDIRDLKARVLELERSQK